MHRAVVSLPDGLDRKLRWLAGRALRRGRACESPRAGRRCRSTRRGISRPPRRCSRARRSSAAPVDEHGRFLASASALAPGAAPLDDLVLALREAAGAGDGAGLPRRRALRRCADARHRHAVALEQARACCGAASRLKGALGAPRRDDGRAWRRPVSRSRRCTSCSAATPTGRTAASPRPSASAASARPASCSRRIATRTTAPLRRSTTRAAPRLVAELDAARARGRPARQLHLPRRRGAAGRASAPCSRGLLGGPVAGNRHHYLRLPWHDGIRALDRLGFSYDMTLGHAERPGPRAGPLVPVPPLGRRRRQSRCASSSSRSS